MRLALYVITVKWVRCKCRAQLVSHAMAGRGVICKATIINIINGLNTFTCNLW